MNPSARIFVFGLAFAVAACGFEAPPPHRTAPPPTPQPPLSTVTATLAIPMTAIVEALNETTKTEIAKINNEPIDCAIAKCALDLVATRTGPISGSAESGRVTLDVPLAATAELDLNSSLFRTKAHSLAVGEVKTETAIALAPDWHLKTDTQGHVDLSQAQLRLGPLKMSFSDIWNRNQQALTGPLFRTLDRHLASAVKIKPQAERLWMKAQRPIRVGKEPQAWLKLTPERVRVSTPVTRDGALIVSLGVDVRARVVVGDRPPDEDVLRTLPPPAPLVVPSNTFAFVIPVLVPYDEAARLALARLSSQPLNAGNARVRFTELAFLPSGEDVVVQTGFCVSQSWDPFGWFDSCGEGYLRGKPVFDAKDGVIRVVNVHYDIATEDLLLHVMRFLAGDVLAKAVQTKLAFSVGRDIERLDREIAAALARPQGRGVSISGDVTSFGTPSLTWTKDGFLATFPARGTLKADLNLKSGLEGP